MNLTLDLNTILTTVVLGTVMWILRTLIALDKKQASHEANTKALDDKVVDHGHRLTGIEHEVGSLKVKVARNFPHE
jgi:hypothetical protein